MPRFTLAGKTYNNPIELALDKIGGRWKMPILWRLSKKTPWRYGELKRNLEGISHKMLSQQLKELERDGFVTRKMYPVVPPKVEYSLTKKGERVMPVIGGLGKLGSFLRKEGDPS